MDVDYVRVYPYSTKTTSTTLSPIANVYVQDGVSATKNFSGSPTLLVENGATGDKQNSYLKFDLSNITAPVLQATLYLTPVAVGESETVDVANYVPNSKTVNVANYVPDNGWTASGITWNSQPAISARLSTGTNYGQGMLTSFDVTTMAKAGKQFSVQIAGDDPSKSPASIAYGSQDNDAISDRPKLVVISGDSSTLQQPTADDHNGPHATH
jgi:hyaluronate lyase